MSSRGALATWRSLVMKKYYIYLLTNKVHTVLYIGVTSNLASRVWQHKEKIIEGFSKKYNVSKLVYYEEYDNVVDALNREKQIKKFSRKRKESLINNVNNRWEDLSYRL